MLKKPGEVSSKSLAPSAMQQGAGETAVNTFHARSGKPGKKDCGYFPNWHPPNKKNCQEKTVCYMCWKNRHRAAIYM